MGVFGNIANAKYSEGGVYLKDGVHKLEIVAVKYIKTRKQQDAFVVEFKVLESTNPEHAIGSLCSWMVTMDKEPALGNVKQFMQAALKCGGDAVTEEVCLYACTEEAPSTAPAERTHDGNPLKGVIVQASAQSVQTKRNTTFTKVKFLDCDGNATQA